MWKLLSIKEPRCKWQREIGCEPWRLAFTFEGYRALCDSSSVTGSCIHINRTDNKMAGTLSRGLLIGCLVYLILSFNESYCVIGFKKKKIEQVIDRAVMCQIDIGPHATAIYVGIQSEVIHTDYSV